LQEVDESAFQKYLNPIFTQAGYVSHHTTKNGTTVEGCATFVSSTKFKTLANIDISLRDVFKSKKKTFEHYLHQFFKVKPDIYEILTQKITTIAQISILKYNNNPRHLCLVANTHLFYHPDAGYIRLLQVHEIMQKLEQIKSSILLCNEHEDPDNALHKYLVSLCADDSSREDENVEYVNEGLVDNELNGFEKLLSQTDYNEGKVYEGEIHSDFGGHQDCDFEVSCFFLGDLNSTVNTGAIEYIER
jgi:mRNA deadenylase 3'-5' endonuclease subunit Ccr4